MRVDSERIDAVRVDVHGRVDASRCCASGCYAIYERDATDAVRVDVYERVDARRCCASGCRASRCCASRCCVSICKYMLS